MLILIGTFLMFSGPSTIVVINHTGATMRDVEFAVSRQGGERYVQIRAAMLAVGDSLRWVGHGRLESNLELRATGPDGREIGGKSYVYLDDLTLDRFEVISDSVAARDSVEHPNWTNTGALRSIWKYNGVLD